MGQATPSFEVGCVVSWKQEPADDAEERSLELMRELYGDGPFNVSEVQVALGKAKIIFPEVDWYVRLTDRCGRALCCRGMSTVFPETLLEEVAPRVIH